ncbi:hydroxyproline-rich glycoprotein family protein [Prunus dulcis]|uniref:Hydroxyproline-rich glycoprotein family protein n=1 Tax=Prunus dulcis TaxID=3755 RepID=A0A4Y1QVK1_PRUDU|nr:hydroxyproline-rich glycoprotein family protein [Prunus dulcis]
MEAEEAEASHSVTTSAAPGYLSNPFAEDSAAIPVHKEPCAPSRFDFYTDPMAAFSSDTKRVKVGNQIVPSNFGRSNTGGSPMARLSSALSGGPRNPEMTAPPSHQFQSNYSPDQRMYQVQQGFCQNFGPQRNPIGIARPFPMHHGNPPEVWNGAEGAANYSFPSDPSRECRFPGPGFRPPGSPGFRPPGSPGFRPPGSPGLRPQGSSGFGPPGSPGFRPPGSPGFGPQGSPGFGPPGSPGFGPPASPGFRPLGSPGSNSGQGRGTGVAIVQALIQYMEAILVLVQVQEEVGGTGAQVLDRDGEVEEGWALMVVLQWKNNWGQSDPWKFLKPVIWKGVDTPMKRFYSPGSSKPPIEKSSSTKDASISEGSNKSTSQPSLAEYLAASFNDAVKDTPTT